MWSIRCGRGLLTVAIGCWCYQLVRAQPSQDIGHPQQLRCDELCEFSSWAMHAFCGERDLGDIPQQCSDVKTLDMRSNNIVVLRTGRFVDFRSLKYLYLVNNGLRQIEDGAFEGCDGLQFLSWGNNPFPVLSAPMLEGLTNLMHMQISSSILERIERETFRETPTLKTLDLTDNMLISPPCDAFPRGNVLTHLYLSYNKITILPQRCFQTLGNLKRLVLSNNPINDIVNVSAFTGLDTLWKLEMKNISLQLVPTGAFGYVHSVTFLVLSNNLIQTLEERDFAALPELTHLYLEYNRINTVHQRTFIGLPYLKVISLSNNRIVSIGLHAFLPVEGSLEELHLQDNHLPSIYNISSSSVLSLKKFRLARNPLICHCHLHELRLYLLEQSVHSSNTDEDSITCTNPGGGETVTVVQSPSTRTKCAPLSASWSKDDQTTQRLMSSNAALFISVTSAPKGFVQLSDTKAPSLSNIFMYVLISVAIVIIALIITCFALRPCKLNAYQVIKKSHHHNDKNNNTTSGKSHESQRNHGKGNSEREESSPEYASIV